jgi:aryl-alcohol dehydrogenase-like predicted oxidoreductase
MAMEAGLWFHLADYGGGVYDLVKPLFAGNPAQRPRCVVKTDGTDPGLFLESVEDSLRRTGLERIDIAQVCGNPVDETFDALAEAAATARERGWIGACIMDVLRSYSARVEQAVRNRLFDGYIFYYNVMEREVTNRLFALLEREEVPVLAMRTFGGRDRGNFMKPEDANHPRRAAVQAVFERSGCAGRTDFCVRFPLSIPFVRTTIGSTGNPQHLHALLDAGDDPEPLPESVVRELMDLHRQWDESAPAA